MDTNDRAGRNDQLGRGKTGVKEEEGGGNQMACE